MKNQVKFIGWFGSVVLVLGFVVIGAVSQAQAQSLNQQDCSPQYSVQRGEWLAAIARRCGVTLQAVLDANTDLPNPNLVFPGQVVNLPVQDQAALSADQTDQSGQTVQTTPESGVTDPQNPFASAPPDVDDEDETLDQSGQTDLSGQQQYTIQPGDTLIDLAARLGVSLEELVQLNPNLLQPGGTLVLPSGAPQAPDATPEPTDQAGAGPTQQPSLQQTVEPPFGEMEP